VCDSELWLAGKAFVQEHVNVAWMVSDRSFVEGAIKRVFAYSHRHIL